VPTVSVDPIEAFYTHEMHHPERGMTAHLPRVRALADGLAIAVEFGVKRGASSAALLLGATRVVSYDIVETPQARVLQRLAGSRWEYRLEDSRTAAIPACDLLLVDSLHTYAQVQSELCQHAAKVRRWLVFHDTITFGSIGAHGETGQHLWRYVQGQSVPMAAMGIRPAIDELMIRDPSWMIRAHHVDSHGLLVLERAR
jgi:hypothetical protein